MSDAILDLIEKTAADPGISDDVRDWLMESGIPVLCEEIRRLRAGSRPVDLVGSILASAPPPPAGTVARIVHGVGDPRPRPVLKTEDPAPKPKGKPGPKKGQKQAGGRKTTGVPVPGLKAAMDGIGMTSGALAEELGVNKSSINNWRVGRYFPAEARLRDLAAALSCGINDLTGAT